MTGLEQGWFCFGCCGPMPSSRAHCPSCEEEMPAYRWWGNERGAVRFTSIVQNCVVDAEELAA